MPLIILFAASVFAALAAWSHIERPEWMTTDPVLIWTLVFAVPTGALWAAAELVNWISPRRLLDRRVRAPFARALLGLICGVLGAALCSLGVVFLDGTLPDTLILAAGGVLGALPVVLALPRVKAGRCIHCHYDLSANTVRSGGLCAECGAAAA